MKAQSSAKMPNFSREPSNAMSLLRSVQLE
jgi:hypothetical protein